MVKVGFVLDGSGDEVPAMMLAAVLNSSLSHSSRKHGEQENGQAQLDRERTAKNTEVGTSQQSLDRFFAAESFLIDLYKRRGSFNVPF